MESGIKLCGIQTDRVITDQFAVVETMALDPKPEQRQVRDAGQVLIRIYWCDRLRTVDYACFDRLGCG